MVMCRKINCRNVQKCLKVWHSGLAESVARLVMQHICFGHRGHQVSETCGEEVPPQWTTISSWRTWQTNQFYILTDLIVTSLIQVSLLRTTDHRILQPSDWATHTVQQRSFIHRNSDSHQYILIINFAEKKRATNETQGNILRHTTIYIKFFIT